MEFKLKLTANIKDTKCINTALLKIYGQGNKREEVIEIYSERIPVKQTNSEEINESFWLKDILLSSIFGNKNKQFCWFEIFLEGIRDQSQAVIIYQLFPIYKDTVLRSQQRSEFISIQKCKEKIPAMLDQKQSSANVIAASYSLSSITFQEAIGLKQFLHAGMNFNLIAGIDFTKSNGKNKDRQFSLHTIAEIDKNPYVKALKVVADMLIQFDNDLLVPMYGFGGRPTLPHFTLKRTSHCFPIIGSEQYPELHDLKGMMAAYFNIIDNQVFLEGPTNFQPLIQLARKAASVGKGESDKNYYILLIITDGIINDGEKTVEEIKLCVDLPISIVIVGVGEENFDDMDYLNSIKDVKRDLVSFVDMKYYDEQKEKSFQASVLEELPGQVTEYYERQKIKPDKMVTRFEAASDEDLSGNEAWKRINNYKKEILQKYEPLIEPLLFQN